MGYRRFVAVGDSCTEGIDDPYPDGAGYRGWADLVAGRLALRQPGLRYANLAVRGRRLDQIYAEQVATACSVRPDLASVLGGGNDVLQGRFDPDRVARSLDNAVRDLTGVARTVLVFTLPELGWRRIGSRNLACRITAVNEAVADVAARYSAVLIDLRDDPATTDRRYFGPDRLHLGVRGHQRLAAHVLRTLGIAHDEQWLGPPPSSVTHPRWQRVANDVRWLREHVAPAVYGTVRNRILGRQPGDGFVPKRPQLRPVR